MGILSLYKNGNYNVLILSDGTKIRFTDQKNFVPSFPESIDLKITNQCDSNCQFCHENSNSHGKHGDIDKIINQLKYLPPFTGIELAIGGGNPLIHPDLEKFLKWGKIYGFICNMTINANHIKKYKSKIQYLMNRKLIYGIGISYNGIDFYDDIFTKKNENIVYHMILGIHSFEDILNISEKNKILILGFKKIGRGLKFYQLNSINIDKNINLVKMNLWKILGKRKIAFDNLAISQLELQKFVTSEGWKKNYMGDDGSFTMYYDGVDDTFNISSTSPKHNSINSLKMNLLEYFQKNL